MVTHGWKDRPVFFGKFRTCYMTKRVLPIKATSVLFIH